MGCILCSLAAFLHTIRPTAGIARCVIILEGRKSALLSLSLSVQETQALPSRHRNHDKEFFRGRGLWSRGIDAFLVEGLFLGGVIRVC
jgi:hypothetical protein